MPLYPNLHLLIPGAEGVLIEARIYLPRSEALRGLPLNNSESSTPTPLTSLAAPARAALTRLGIRRVVTAAHPYARLGGNMMFPVLVAHIPGALFASQAPPGTAYTTFNVRGVGKSEGSMPWPGWGIGKDHEDFAAIETAVAGLFGTPDLYRIGYSYGTNLALNAPASRPIKRTLLISPAPALFRAMCVFAGPTFTAGLSSALDRAIAARAAGDSRSLWHVYGDKDDFTGAATLRVLGGERRNEITSVEVPGCGHFYTRAEDGAALRKAVGEWISE